MYIYYIHIKGYALCITLVSLLLSFQLTKGPVASITNLSDDSQVFLIVALSGLILEEVGSNSARIFKLKSEPIMVLNISVPQDMTMNVANPYFLSTHLLDSITALTFTSTASPNEGLNTISHFNEKIFEDFSSSALILKHVLGNA
mgnify:FL=1